MFGVLLRRWRETESLVRHSDKMAQLGTLSAGLAHEINNPASAVKRAAEDLPEAVEAYAAARERLAAAGMPEALGALLEQLAAGEKPVPPPGSPIARSDAESTLEEWLEGHGISDAWDHASTLVAAGVDAGVLEGLGLEGDDLGGAVNLITAAAAANTSSGLGS